ncbi:MAG TPA: hypothetical protein VK708_09150 [Bryobacteraceae bacterium]|nr:hypothetical protein [Bryobacteraceae bacterium]
MRGILACFAGSTILSMLLSAADTGVPPRGTATDYPAHGPAGAADIAADIVPPNQVAKMFSPEISKQYIVVEVAIYPGNGVPFDVESKDFALQAGEHVSRGDLPIDVAPWPEARGPGRRVPVDVTTETGIIYQRSNDPVYGRQQGVGTYSGVGVSAPGQSAPPPPPDPKADPRVVYDKVRRYALAEGDTKTAIAGYLYFPQYAKRRKSDAIELKYTKDDVALNLVLGKP